ncbi:vitamin D(3) 25-hydroxylase-like [Haliotis rufescens]|uniref:vitamin D(3) 25-hydroxylase-like n=1 Tax=Haliotis rufescens TaxID=6454 RepID=UPI001EB0A4FB|nr:vitamin D(3) 25-hydroxylase-like [Haliotis rufescens]
MAAMLNQSNASIMAAVALLAGLLMFNTSLILVFVTVLLILWLSTRRHPGLPPGPPLLPLVGNIFQMDADPRVTFSKLRRQYGDIFSVYIFHKPVIVLNGYNVHKEALVKNADVFSDRPHSFLSDIFGHNKGILSTNGSTWKDMRKFAVTTLREFGVGRSTIEEKIQQELDKLLKAFEDEGSNEFDCKRHVHTATSNIVSDLCFGKHYEYNDPRFIRLLDAVEEMITDLGAANVLDVFPAVRFLPGDFFNYKRLMRNIQVLEKEVAKHIEEHVNNYEEDEPVEDFTSAFLKEVRRRKQRDETFDESHLSMFLIDIFTPGTYDNANSIKWSLLHLLHYPEVQEKCFQEIQEHVGFNRRPSMKDKTSLSYVEATLSEVLRHADMVPTGVPHTVPHDVQFQGYTFPKGVTIIPMLNSVLHDPATWGDPQNFRPERFLDHEGKFRKRDELVAFSLGRRACPGESLGRMELFLVLTTLIQRFKFVPPSGTLQPLIGIMGFANNAPPFKCKAIPRNI